MTITIKTCFSIHGIRATTLLQLLFPFLLLFAVNASGITVKQQDTSDQKHIRLSTGPETEILLLRRKELDTETRIERLKIDISTIERKWQEERENETGRLLLTDSITPSQLKAKVLREQLTTYRIDLENAQFLLDCLRKQRSLLRKAADTRTSSADVIDLWQSVIDSAAAFQTLLATEQRWRTDRLSESRFEHDALLQILDSSDINLNDRRLLKKRKSYLENRVSSDSLLLTFITALDSTLSGYSREAENALLRSTPDQKRRQLIRQIRNIWNFTIYTVDDKPLTIGKVLLALIIIFAGLKIAHFISRLIATGIKKSSKLDEGVIDAGRKLFFYTFSALFTLYALYLAQVPLTAFTVMGGALALGLGFGSQNILKNFISGIIILLERPMKTGDFLEVDGVIGTVESIGLRSTRVRTPNNVHMVLPNSSFLEKNVINWTLSDRVVRLEVQVGIQYGSPVREAERLLLEAAHTVPAVLKKPEPEVLFSDFGDNALVFHLYFSIRIVHVIDRRRVLSTLRFAINDLFNAAGIVIAFPQRDVHFDMNTPLRVNIEPHTPVSSGQGDHTQ